MEKHEKARSSLCLICLDRSSQSIPNTKYEELVEKFVVQDYNPLDPRLPSGLCFSCASKLARYGTGSFDQVLPGFYDYSTMANYRPTRGMSSCGCHLCGKYRVVGLKSSRRKIQKLKPGQHVSKSTTIHETNSNIAKPIGLFCTKCFQMLYPGCKHPCTQISLQANVRKLIPDKTLERVTRTILQEKKSTNQPLTLASSGLPTPIQFGIDPNPMPMAPKLKIETLLQIKVNTGLSSRNILKVAQGIRADVGVESGLYKALSTVNTRLTGLFEHSVEQLPNHGSFPLIFCNDPKDFIRAILVERGVTSADVFLRLSIDEGKGFLKISGNLVMKNPAHEANKFLSSGVKKTFLLAIAPVKESYASIKVLLSKLDLNFNTVIEEVYSQDLKCYNIVLGLGNHKSTFPCIYCFWINGQ